MRPNTRQKKPTYTDLQSDGDEGEGALNGVAGPDPLDLELRVVLGPCHREPQQPRRVHARAAEHTYGKSTHSIAREHILE